MLGNRFFNDIAKLGGRDGSLKLILLIVGENFYFALGFILFDAVVVDKKLDF